jgi:hypothetical protein
MVGVRTPTMLVPEPEMLTRADMPSGRWTVYSGNPFAVVDERILSVPVGNDEVVRHIQTHEMVHAKFSPSEKQMETLWLKRGFASTQALICCEELRVHSYMKHIGFEPEKYIQDGSGSFVGGRIGLLGTLKDAILQAVKYSRTAEYIPYMEALQTHKPEWVANVSEIVKAGLVFFDTSLTEYPKNYSETHSTNAQKHGFAFTEEYARWVEQIAGALEENPSDSKTIDPSQLTKQAKATKKKIAEAGRILKHSADYGMDTPKKGIGEMWEELKVSQPMLTKNVFGSIGKKRSASQVGKNPRRITHLYSDPQRRIFDRVTRGEGGVVLIDASGSMYLSENQVRDILIHSPNAIVAQYSGNARKKPNLYVIGRKGKMVDKLPEPAGGNGVDGPALEWALKQRKNSKEPIVWVSDGGVTGKHDNYSTILVMQCISICKKNGIYVVPTAELAVELLKDIRLGKKVSSIIPNELSNVYEMETGHDLWMR